MSNTQNTGNTIVSTPNLDQLLINVASSLPFLYSIIGVVCFVLGFWYVFMGILDLASSTGQARFMGAQKATPFSGTAKILIGALVANFAMDLNLVNIFTSIVSGSDTAFKLASIDSYSTEPTQSTTQYLMMTIAIGFTQIVGMIAVFMGLRIWVLTSDGKTNKTALHGLVFIIGGVACIQIVRVHDFFARFLGFDFFQIVGFK